MASPFQQQSRRRKLIYTALIVLLFALNTFGLRGFESGGANPPPWTVAGRANDLKIREKSQGDVELTGSAISLGLTGSKGFVVCALWQFAIEAQKRHEWNELELLVRSLTKLQPHFITPWLFQSWNLAYNVSVESDLVRDKYFYISRGIELLADGERKNKDHPDLRFSLGFYNQHKIGMADENRTLRSLYQMSCIPPAERDPNRLRRRSDSGRLEILPDKFEEFCRKYPMMVRRLRDQLRFETPEEIVEFLEANYKIPSRYAESPVADSLETAQVRLKPSTEQFPILPPFFSDAEPHHDLLELGDAFDNFTCARAWFSYSLLPLPDPSPIPSFSHPPYNRYEKRMPRYIAVHIFRGYPSRAQTYIAETQQKEGWFDRDGWLIRGWFPEDKFGDGRPSRVGDTADWSRDAWGQAFRMWQLHGEQTGLYKTPLQLKALEDEAQVYRQAMRLNPWDRPVPLPPDNKDETLKRGYEAHDQLYWYDRNRDMTNFAHFYHTAQVEMQEPTIKARKLFFEAERLRSREGLFPEAIETYAQACQAWLDILLKNPEFARDSNVLEDTYEIQLRYLNLLQKQRGRRLKELSLVGDLLAKLAWPAPGYAIWLPPLTFARDVVVPIPGPFDVNDKSGKPLIDEDIRRQVRIRMGLPEVATPAPVAPSPPLPPSETPVTQPTPTPGTN